MKKRIFSLILAAVMLCLSLVGCTSFDYVEDASQYASFNSQAFFDALKKIEIENGTFTADPAVRAERVEDYIYSTLASNTGKTVLDQKTEGKPGEHDLVYYAYYITATVNGVDYVFSASTMAVGKAEETQLGLNKPSDLEGKINELFKDYEFNKDTNYKATSDFKVKELKDGQLVFVSYNRNLVDGDDSTDYVAKQHPLIVSEDELFIKSLVKGTTTKDGKETIPSTLKITKDDIKKLLEDKYEGAELDAAVNENFKRFGGDYTGVKVEWVSEIGAKPVEFKEVTYTDIKSLTPTMTIDKKTTVDVKGIELTYNVYPVHYFNLATSFADKYMLDAEKGETFTFAEQIVNVAYGKNFKADAVEDLLFGHEFHEKTEDEQKAVLDKYKFKVDGVDLTLDEFLTKISEEQTSYTTKKSDYVTAKNALDEKQKAYDSAKKAVDDAGDKVTETQTKALKTAEEALKTAQDSLKKTEDNLKKEAGDVKELVTEFFKVLDTQKITKDKFVELYRENIVYQNLMTAYDTEIKNNLAKAVYDILLDEKSGAVSVNATLPEKAVKEAEDYLLENYQFCFYNDQPLGEGNKAPTTSFYSTYGDFDKFLVKYAVPNDLNVTIDSSLSDKDAYNAAMDAVKKAAEKHVKELLIIQVVAEGLGVVVNDADFEAYLETDEFLNKQLMDYLTSGGIMKDEETYRTAYQFDKVMNKVLESERVDVDGKANEHGKFVKYKNFPTINFKKDAK